MKTCSIQTLQPDIKNKYIKFSRRHKLLLEQLQYFPMADHDDGPDALEGLRTIAQGGRKKRLIVKKRRFGMRDSEVLAQKELDRLAARLLRRLQEALS